MAQHERLARGRRRRLFDAGAPTAGPVDHQAGRLLTPGTGGNRVDRVDRPATGEQAGVIERLVRLGGSEAIDTDPTRLRALEPHRLTGVGGRFIAIAPRSPGPLNRPPWRQQDRVGPAIGIINPHPVAPTLPMAQLHQLRRRHGAGGQGPGAMAAHRREGAAIRPQQHVEQQVVVVGEGPGAQQAARIGLGTADRDGRGFGPGPVDGAAGRQQGEQAQGQPTQNRTHPIKATSSIMKSASPRSPVPDLPPVDAGSGWASL